MADSLLDLRDQIDAQKAEASGPPIEEPAGPPIPEGMIRGGYVGPVAAAKPPPRQTATPGDAVMAQANALLNPKPEELTIATRISQSHDMVLEKMSQDPQYHDRVATELGNLKGPAVANRLVDLADEIKIENLKKTEPELFNGPVAALYGFSNSAMFGQLSRLQGYAGQVIQGRPAEEIMAEQGEKLRLIQKAFPKSDITGKVLSFMIPGSPVKAVFGRVTNWTGKGIANLLAEASKNPSLLEKLAAGVTAGATGAGTVGLISGTLGQDNQEVSFDRGVESSLRDAKQGALWSALLPVAGVAAKKVGAAASGGIANGVANFVEQVSGTPASALRAYNQRGAAIRQASDPKFVSSLAEELTDFLQGKKASLPEVQQANQLLPKIGEVDASKVIRFLERAKTMLRPDDKQYAARFDEWITRLKGMAPEISDPSGLVRRPGVEKMSAQTLRQFVDDIQATARDAYGKDSNSYLSALKVAGRIGRLAIVDKAASLGTTEGDTYVALMRQAASKRGILEFLMRRLGRDEGTMATRAEGFLNNLFGKNKTFIQQRMEALDAKFGTNFSELAENAKVAAQLGPGGQPQWLPTQKTGATMLGQSLGAAVGGVAGGAAGFLMGHGLAAAGQAAVGAGGAGFALSKVGQAAGAVISSPKTGAFLIGNADRITGFVKALTSDPATLGELAKTNRFGVEVRRMAVELSDTLDKHGPISTGSLTRVLADTPFFFGLVHGFDRIKEEQSERKTESVLKKYGPKNQ